MTPEEIREALAKFEAYEAYIKDKITDAPTVVLMEAARLYADLLENGQRKRAEQRELSVMPWVLVVPGPGRYLVAPVQEDT